jgi:type II secretory pathway component PulF
MSSPSSNPAITLDQLIALNDEIASLVRAGVPLERGLADMGRDMPGGLGDYAAMLSDRIGRGESLAEVVGQTDGRLPKIYRAVVEAGISAGRLPAALESLAGSMRRIVEIRRSVVGALLYPCVMLIFVWAFFAFFTAVLAPIMLRAFESLGVPGVSFFKSLAWFGRSVWIWGPLGPLVLVILAAIWWRGTTQAAVAGPSRAMRLFGWIPWLGGSLRWSRTAAFAEILALLLENGMPMDQAVLMAGDASGDPELIKASHGLAAALQRGGTVSSGLPPLLDWLLVGGLNQTALLPALHNAARCYQRRAQHQADLARMLLPVLAAIGISGAAALCYALVLFVPYTTMLRSLAKV